MGSIADKISKIDTDVKEYKSTAVNQKKLSNEVRRKITEKCFPGMHRPDIFSAIGKLVAVDSIHWDQLIENADYFRGYISPNSDTMMNKTVEDVIEEHRKDYNDQLGSRANQFSRQSEASTATKEVDTKQGLTSNVFIPNWNNKPKTVPPVLKLADTNILTHQNISAIIASPGSGKTSCVESIGASYLNPDCDCLGFRVDPSCQGVILVDTERTTTDVWNSYDRMCRRAGISYGNLVENVLIAGMRGVSNVDERKSVIEDLLKNNPCSILLIDGAADLVRDTNDAEQSKEAQGWLKYLTVTYNVSILCTLHPNPGTSKARGHTGSEMLRDSETILLIKDFEGAKILTSDFEYGKNRNAGKITTGFKWSDTEMMFVSVDYDGLAASKKSSRDVAKRQQAELLAKDLIPPPKSLRHTDFQNAVMQKTSKGESTAITLINNMVGWGIVSKIDGVYRLVV